MQVIKPYANSISINDVGAGIPFLYNDIVYIKVDYDTIPSKDASCEYATSLSTGYLTSFTNDRKVRVLDCEPITFRFI